MDMYKLKFTILQQEILQFLFIKAGMSFNERGIARQLKVSPTAVSNSLKVLEKEDIIKVSKDKESGRLAIELNRENIRVFFLKRIENLRMIYESGLVEYLTESFPAATIILFGSYSFGEDTINSDIDIAIIGSMEKEPNLQKFDKILEREISLQFYKNFREIHKNLKENILNGIILKGAVEL